MSTAVVHLVRAANGPEAPEAFLRSYEAHAAGAEHRLVLLLKGFAGDGDPLLERVRSRAARHAPEEVRVGDEGLDLTAYLHAARVLPDDRLCFVNSFSELLVGDWLGCLERAMEATGAGAAGATASWGSHLSYNLWQLGLPSAFGDAFPSRAVTREAIRQLDGAREVSLAAHMAYALWVTLRFRRGSARFPVAHLRTNAFLIDRLLLRQAAGTRTATKWDTYRLESGPGSLTARLRAIGRAPVVADRHGTVHPVERWPDADVFFQAGQEALLVADNQTRSYQEATPLQRWVLSASAWGPWARPGID